QFWPAAQILALTAHYRAFAPVQAGLATLDKISPPPRALTASALAVSAESICLAVFWILARLAFDIFSSLVDGGAATVDSPMKILYSD
ncbi:MAG: hypothetical protein NT121_26145, partial [Chloroflexi bacterium]|nr:hypothetical protein [Chloroflexota bacterium]